MAASVLVNAAKLAVRMIGKFGALVTLTKTVRGTYVASTDTRGADTVSAVAVLAVEQPYTPLLGVGLGMTFEQQTAITADARSFLVAGPTAPFAPEPGMTFTTANGKLWVVSSVKTDSPDGVPILYTCACKAA